MWLLLSSILLLWLGLLFDQLELLGRKLDVSIVDIYDCGMFGCAFQTADGMAVIKVTSDEGEARAWDAIFLEKQKSLKHRDDLIGFADVYAPVVELTLKGYSRPLHIIVREPLADIGEVSPNLAADMDWIATFAQVGRLDSLNQMFDKVNKNYPKMHDVIRAIAIFSYTGILIYDLHPANLGLRPGSSSYVLRDPSNPHLPGRRWRAKKRLKL